MKKLLVLVLVLALSLSLFAGCGEKNDTLTLYTEATFAPFEFVDGTEVVGVDIEIGKKIAEKLGKKLVVKNVSFDVIIGSLTDENAIGLAGISIDADRAEQVDFSVPYFEDIQLSVVTMKDTLTKNTDGETSTGALKDLTIGVQTGTSSDLLVNDIVKPSKTVKQYKDILIGLQDLKEGVIDAFVIDSMTAEESTKEMEVTITLIEDQFEAYGAAVKKGNDKLLKVVNEVIEEMLKNGEIEKLVEQFTK